MRLKNIKLAGFKSFVDPTTIPFNKNLVAVVGPNGCGKSNVVDAIRWVMGESSAKTLRGESMSDVIFNGSTERKPVSQASVQLTFDNSDGSIGGEYAQYAEISIKRVASRDGTSDYFLNNTKCRRKDITDVFLGTGLGPRSYSVIEQGMISRFIEAKPDELRMYLEEAAGISKYKERRRETETRIRHSRENLERVKDLCDEIGMQLEKLQRQAKAAERYRELKQEERLNKAQLLVLQSNSLDHELQSYIQSIKSAEVLIEERIAEQRHLGAEIERQRETQTELSDTLNEVQGRYYGLGAEIAKIEQSIAHYRERYQQLTEDKARIEQSMNELKHNAHEDSQNLIKFREELTALEPEFNLAKEKHSISSDLLEDAEMSMQSWQGEWEIFSQEAAQAIKTAEVEQTRIQHTERMIQQLEQRIAVLKNDAAQFDFSMADDELKSLLAEQTTAEHNAQTQHHTLDNVTAQLHNQRELNRSLNAEWDSVRRELQESKGRYASLNALQQAALGQNDHQIKQWLEKNGVAEDVRLAKKLTVDHGWEVAVQTVLGTHLEAICVDGFDSVKSMLSEFPGGNCEFFMDSPHPNLPPQAGEGIRLSSKVKASDNVLDILSHVYCADNLDAALALAKNLDRNASVITKEGLWLSRAWLRVSKDQDKQAGVLQRERELEHLKSSLKELETRVEFIEQSLEEGKEKLNDLELEREEIQQQVNKATESLSESKMKVRVHQDQLQQSLERSKRVADELTEREQLLLEQQGILKESRHLWQRALTTSEEFSSRKKSLEDLGLQCREQLLMVREQVRQDNDHKHHLEVRVEQIRPQIQAFESNIERSNKQLHVMMERLDVLSASLDEGEEPIAELQKTLHEKLSQRVIVENEMKAVRQRVESVVESIRELESSKEDIILQIENARRALEEKRLEVRTLEVRKTNYQDQLLELDFTFAAVLAEMPEGANITAWAEEAERIASRIQRLGPINLAAIDEYKVEEERKQYLDAQYNDLIEALTTLENAIQKIDKETRAKFKETFDKVNESFQVLFPVVFGGGSAYLELLGDDLLDTGVTVMARPPGKKNTSIHLLSGGEKALTAVSLVFSIFQLNPAPFCLLDEVDAPLDDANVARFCNLVKDMSSKVQFVFISHNKLAIEMADQLTGVTMHEPGVSRIVAVDMEEAVKMATA